MKPSPSSVRALRPQLKYQVEWSDDRGRHRKYFTNRIEASDFRNELEVKTAQAGVAAASVDADTIRAWLELEEQAKEVGGSLDAAVKMYVRHQKARGRSCPVSEAVVTFLRHRAGIGRADRTVANLRSRLNPLLRNYGNSLVAEVERGDVERLLADLRGGLLTRNHYRDVMHGFFTWALKTGLCDENPVEGIEKANVRGSLPRVLTPSELRLVFSLSPREMWPEFALGAFAGLRESEIVRLHWEDVDLDRGHIDLRRIVTKNNASRRLVDILPACRAFLEAVGPNFNPKSGVLPSNHDVLRRNLRKALRERGTPWPSNALRHSFASYYLALYQDGGKLALQLGHGGGMAVLMKHYREIVTSEAAGEWFEIRSADGEKKVVELLKLISDDC